MFEPTIDHTNEKFLITDKPVMVLATDVLQILNKIDRITIRGEGEFCPATVSVANIITQNLSNSTMKTEKISIDSQISDDGRMISTLEIIIAKTNNQ